VTIGTYGSEKVVGATGFEPATSCAQVQRVATRCAFLRQVLVKWLQPRQFLAKALASNRLKGVEPPTCRVEPPRSCETQRALLIPCSMADDRQTTASRIRRTPSRHQPI